VDVSPKQLSGLIGSIYDYTLVPSRWEHALGDMIAVIDCHNALLSLTGMRYQHCLWQRLPTRGGIASGRPDRGRHAFVVRGCAPISE
jgi:hypothetical protein